MLIAQRRQKVAIAVNVRMEPLELTDERSLGFLIFRIESADLRMQQVTEEERGFLCSFRIPPAPSAGRGSG